MLICWQISDWKLHRQTVVKCLDQLLARILLMNPVDTDGAESIQDAGVQQVMNNFAKLTQGLDSVDLASQQIVIVLDDNMYYASMRYEIYQLARKCTYLNNLCDFSWWPVMLM